MSKSHQILYSTNHAQVQNTDATLNDFHGEQSNVHINVPPPTVPIPGRPWPRNTNDGRPLHAHQRTTKKRHIIICLVVLLVIVVAVVVTVVVVVVVTQNKDGSAENKKPGCGPFKYPGINITNLTPRIIGYNRKTCVSDLRGNCWKGEQCYVCFEKTPYKVGNIDNIPVCCEQCELSGLAMSSSSCDCPYNGFG